MKKIISVFVFLCTIALLGIIQVSADEVSELEKEYDLVQGGKQIFYERDEENEQIVTEITEGISKRRLSNKSYTVKKSKALRWTISYQIAIKNNEITSVKSSQFKAITGSFSATSCVKNSSSKATAKGKYKLAGFTSNINVIATISNGKIVIQ